MRAWWRRIAGVLLAALAIGVATTAIGDDDTELAPHARPPENLRPHRHAGPPVQVLYPVRPVPALEGPRPADPVGLEDVSIGLLVPLAGQDGERGRRVRDGVMLAIEVANDRGGYAPGIPFRVHVREENVPWGNAGNAAVDLVAHEGVRALIGAVGDAGSRAVSQVLSRLRVPLVNTAGVDPSVTDRGLPWLVRVRPDARQIAYRLAQHAIETDGHRRIAVLRIDEESGRVAAREIEVAARRLRAPVVLECAFDRRGASWLDVVARLRLAKPDALVIWGPAAASGGLIRALRLAALGQPIYGPESLGASECIKAAEGHANSAVFFAPFDPTLDAPAWSDFVQRYRGRFQTMPDAEAAYAYDGANLLLDAIRAAGLDAERIARALRTRAAVDGVTGRMEFDTTWANVAPVVIGRVEDGVPRFD